MVFAAEVFFLINKKQIFNLYIRTKKKKSSVQILVVKSPFKNSKKYF